MKKNMTDELVWLESDKDCPVCGSSDIEGIEFEFDADSVYNRCVCNECGSKFSFGYWVKNAYITKDGRSDEDN